MCLPDYLLCGAYLSLASYLTAQAMLWSCNAMLLLWSLGTNLFKVKYELKCCVRLALLQNDTLNLSVTVIYCSANILLAHAVMKK